MSRVKHFNDEPHAHYLTFSCYKKMDLLNNDNLCQKLAYSIDNARRRGLFKLLAFVFMPDHVHLLLFPVERRTISSIISAIKQPFSVKALEYYKLQLPEMHKELLVLKGKRIVGRFWEAGGGYDRNIVGRKAIINTVNYIHNNPVKAEFVKNPTDWKWSSAKSWEQGVSDPLRMDVIY